MSIFKKVIIIVLLLGFIAGCVIGTYYAIQYSNKQSYELNSELLKVDVFEKKEDNSDLVIKYDNMHMKNNITTKEKVIDIKYGMKYIYYSIDGLKNKKIQNKINNEIEANVLDIVENLKQSYIEYERDFFMKINFNSSNVISISLNNDYSVGNSINLIYDLTTGNQIKFSDLFINNCQQELWDIFRPKIIRDFLDSNQYVYNEETGKYDPNPMTEEEFLYVMKKLYNENFDNLDFYLHESCISLDLNYLDYYVDLYMELIEFYHLFTGFTKYLTEESIFENGNLENNNYTLLYQHNGVIPIEEYNDNLFIYVTDNKYTKNEIIDNYFNEYLKDIIADYKKIADENPDIVTYLELDLLLDKTQYLNAYPNSYSVSIDKFVYKMSKDEYRNNFRKAIFDHHFSDTYEVEYNKDKVECLHTIDYYFVYLDGENAEPIKLSVSDFFVEGYDYLAVAKEKLLIVLEEDKQCINNEIEVNNMRNAIISLTELPYNLEINGYSFYINLDYNSLGMFDLSIDSGIYIADVFDVNMFK